MGWRCWGCGESKVNLETSWEVRFEASVGFPPSLLRTPLSCEQFSVFLQLGRSMTRL